MIEGPLDRRRLARPQACLGVSPFAMAPASPPYSPASPPTPSAATHASLGQGCTAASIVGEPPENPVALRIVAGQVDPASHATRPPARAGAAGWADASLHTAALTPDLIEGARLQPAAVAQPWAELSADKQAAAEELGLEDAGDWTERFEYEWNPWPDLSGRQQQAAMTLGFDEPQLWPPRSVTTASLINSNFSVATLKRFLQCRQLKPMPKAKWDMARAARSIIQEEACVSGRDGVGVPSLFSPEGERSQGPHCHLDTQCYISYGESLMKYNEGRLNDSAARG